MKLQSDAARLHAPPQTLADIRQNGFRLFLSGVSNNFYRTEYTTNWINWFALQTNQLTSAETQVVDQGASNAARRYYRSRLWP